MTHDDLWRVVACPRCGGSGLTNVYTASGDDYLGAGECTECANGHLYVRPSGHVFLYPGGPAAGMWRSAYAERSPLAAEAVES